MEQELSGSELSVLEPATDAALAKWWCVLNNGELPTELTPHAPANWVTLDRDRRHDFLWPCMAYIMRRIGHKACLREWNRKSMTDEEFDRWYRSGGHR